MRHAVRFVACALAIAVAGCGSEKGSDASGSAAAEEGKEKLAELTLDEVEQRIAKKEANFYIYDNNGKEMYDEGHLPGAVHLPLDKLAEAKFPDDKSATLLFYCSNEK